ncbi:MAG TPA: allantoicase [Actinocrinis sp.]|uniref:allantoicase n=1 Tax=Actinocrinis sp. TaxID=1920516 RepID=UPI002DDCA3C8|nr:allantoicase [Actinocrinis sp.]HEV2348197.1 allantoicase [Actinocrinis sp.]
MSEAPDTEPPAFTRLPDLASRALGGSVVWANDEFFADKENLINPHSPGFAPATFTHKGQQYDGWETRRRRPGAPGVAGTEYDSAIIRLGAPGIVRGVTVDTAHFLGNYPPHCSVEAAWFDGYPSPTTLVGGEWTTVVEPYPLHGGQVHHIPVDGRRRRYSHVRLNMLPDGGIARLRVHGEPLPDPGYLDGLAVNLAALRDGARITGCSGMFFGRADNMLMPGLARTMGEGWENARRRDGGNDWAQIALIGEGVIRVLEVDTTHYKGNAPDAVKVSAACVEMGDEPGPVDWFTLLPATKLQPDTQHRFLIQEPDSVVDTGRGVDTGTATATHLRLDVYPDGGIARFRALGTLTPRAYAALLLRWQQSA